ncbi:hypothetical protein V5O48_006422 [Marasmius crinis-equi]|uniref:DUF7726 domain-containing protein n=1 Tax=Marasmius crinis-equi TaxID=585013 RepID=A0ABR3FJI8_9AGAR
MPYKFTPSELPNPFLLTAPENFEYLERKEAEFQAAKAAAANKPAKKSGSSKKRKAQEPEPSHDSDAENKPAKKTRTTSGKGKGKRRSAAESQAGTSSSSSGPVDLFSVSLEGEEERQVEIYDSCDEIRRKIIEHLEITECTKAAFLRDIARAGYGHITPQIKIQSKQLSDFLDKEGATAGSTSRVFYGSYVYFEKKRIAEGQPKSDHRLDMEDEWEVEGGLPRERPHSYVCLADSVLVETEMGRVRSMPGRPSE